MKIILSIFITFFGLISFSELIQIIFIDSSDYPFGSDFFPLFSTYHSYLTYLLFNLVVVFFSISAFYNYKKRLFYYLSFIVLILEFYNNYNQ